MFSSLTGTVALGKALTIPGFTSPSPWYHYSAFLTLLPWDNLKELWQYYLLLVLYQQVTHTEGEKMHWPYASSLPPVFKHYPLLILFQKYWQTVQKYCFVLIRKLHLRKSWFLQTLPFSASAYYYQRGYRTVIHPSVQTSFLHHDYC